MMPPAESASPPQGGTAADARPGPPPAVSPAPSAAIAPLARSELFLKFNYPELKDLGKHFLTLSSATTVFLLTFVDKVIKPESVPPISMKVCLVSLTLSIASAGIGLFTNYVAGAGASGAIIWGVGRNFRAFTIGTYLLYMLAGGGLLFAFALLAYQVLSL